jgi:hypothetical protein
MGTITITQLHTRQSHINTFIVLSLQLLQDKVSQFAVRFFEALILDDCVKITRRCSCNFKIK